MPRIDYDAMKPLAGLTPVLDALRKDHSLVVISSNGYRTIRAILTRVGFDSYFQEIFGSDFHLSKKEKIDHALEKYGIPREQAFYIGDTVGDILEARAAADPVRSGDLGMARPGAAGRRLSRFYG